MNILFDLISTQSFIGGGAEYTRRVFYALLDRVRTSDGLQIFALFDSNNDYFPYEDLNPSNLKVQGIKIVDVAKVQIRDIVEKYAIDKLFIGISQSLAGKYFLEGINCGVVTVVHDFHDEDIDNIQLYPYLSLFKSPYYLLRQFAAKIVNKIKDSEFPLKNMFAYIGKIHYLCQNNLYSQR